MTVVEVVAAVIEGRDGRYLLAQRPSGKVYAGWWEFPGGKVESGEAHEAALTRELQEELGVTPLTAFPWITRVHTYEHATVRLRFFRVTAWKGEPEPREGQSITWQQPGSETVGPMLPANSPVLAALSLPRRYGITDACRLGIDRQLHQLESALDAGLQLICVREPGMEPGMRQRFTGQVLGMAHARGARVLVKCGCEHPEADGVHLTAREVLGFSYRPHPGLVAASCHSRLELDRAESLGVDFAVLGSVQPTGSHPGQSSLGWQGFSEAAAGAGIPVFAIGGLQNGDLEAAWRSGAHGIAMIRGAWTPSGVSATS